VYRHDEALVGTLEKYRRRAKVNRFRQVGRDFIEVEEIHLNPMFLGETFGATIPVWPSSDLVVSDVAQSTMFSGEGSPQQIVQLA
jgi:hypothetical protein